MVCRFKRLNPSEMHQMRRLPFRIGRRFGATRTPALEEAFVDEGVRIRQFGSEGMDQVLRILPFPL